MKSVHLVLLGAVAFLMACGQTNPESSPAQLPTDPIQASPDKANPDQTDSRLSAQGLARNIVTVVASKYQGGEVSMVLDANSRPVISYPSTSGDLMLVHCGDTTCSSGNSVQNVETGNRSGRSNSLVLDSSGRPVISYTADVVNDSYYRRQLKLVHCGNANCSSGNIFQNLNTSYPSPEHSSLVLDAAGKPVLSFDDVANLKLAVFHCNDVNCATREEHYLDVGLLFIRDTSLALDSRGYPVVGYVPRTNSNNPNPSLKLVSCGNANCSSGNSIQTVDGGAIVARFPSLVIDSTGLPVMAYYDAANKDLKVVHCGRTNCLNGNFVKAVDTAGDVGNFPSLKLTASGKPVIAHGDATTGTLKWLQCGDGNCSSGNISQVVGVVGTGYATTPSLALDGNGSAVIAYGTSSGQIRLARQVVNTIIPPTLTPALGGTLGTNGWYTSNVTLNWSLVDNGSVITTASGCESRTVNSDTSGITFTCSAINGGGTTQKTVTIKRDATKPVLNPTVSPNPVLKYLRITVNPNASDNLSVVFSHDCTAATTDRVGSFSVTCTAKDSAGNTDTGTVNYTVISASQGIANLMNQVYFSPLINKILKVQLRNILVAAEANLAVSKPATLGYLSQFITVVNSQPPFPYGIDRGMAAILTASAQALIASINTGP
jgi:hypothetical protein